MKATPGTAGAALLRWMRRRGKETSAIELAGILEIHPVQVYSYVSGKKRPGLDRAVKLERLTGIPVRRWAEARR